MTLVQIPENREEEMLREFCSNSVFTFEGADIKSKEGRAAVDKFEEIMRKTGYKEKHCTGFWCYGNVINKYFGLTDDNAYPDDFVFLFVPGYYNSEVKKAASARWFDDIVSSNIIKQNAITFGHEPDFA